MIYSFCFGGFYKIAVSLLYKEKYIVRWLLPKLDFIALMLNIDPPIGSTKLNFLKLVRVERGVT